MEECRRDWPASSVPSSLGTTAIACPRTVTDQIFAALFAVLVFAGLGHWALRTHLDTDWLEGEDGLSEWWSVATYLVAAGLAGATFWTFRTTRNTKLRYLYLALAVGFFLGAMEEIS